MTHPCARSDELICFFSSTKFTISLEMKTRFLFIGIQKWNSNVICNHFPREYIDCFTVFL